MKKFYTRYSFWILLATLLVMIAGMYWWGIRLLGREIAERRDAIQEFHTARDNRSEQFGRLSELKSQYEAIVADEGYLNILYTDDRIVDFIRILEELAAATGTRVDIDSATANADIEVKKEKKKSEKEKETAPTLREEVPFDRYLPLEIAVVGTYPEIVQFLHRLETLPVAHDVVGLSIKGYEPENDRSGGTATLGNPFLLSAPAGSPQESEAAEETRGLLEARLETLLYVDEKR